MQEAHSPSSQVRICVNTNVYFHLSARHFKIHYSVFSMKKKSTESICEKRLHKCQSSAQYRHTSEPTLHLLKGTLYILLTLLVLSDLTIR